VVSNDEKLEDHSLAALIPMMSESEYGALVIDIRNRGQIEPIVLYEGKVIDGRHRNRACRELGVNPSTVVYTGDDPVGHVVALNVHRRHLSASQKAVVALEVERAYAAETKVGRPRKLSQDCENIGSPPIHAAKKAAAAVGVSARYIIDAKAIERDAPDLLPRIASGELTLPEAKNEMRLRNKAAKVAEIALRKPVPLTSLGPFPILLVDPPWVYEDSEPMRAVGNNYPVMTLDDIKALKIPACDDAALFLWATSPKLTEALEVMECWGFRYRTCGVWIKNRLGMGYYFRQQHELLLVGKRGNFPAPDPEDRPSSVITANRTAHSVKPVECHEAIERMYPFHERIELFARRPRKGWTSWGLEA
jgi:N6-adenosine-specific RNA methylase IME4